MLNHLEYAQLKAALDHLRNAQQGRSGEYGDSVSREDVRNLLLNYVEGFVAPNPHPIAKAETPL